jgi:predicted amidohydrolase
MKIAIVQFTIAHLNREKNLGRIDEFIKKAADDGAKVVVFPEDCITGSIFGDLSKLDTSHANREAFIALAKKYAIDIVTGSSMEGAPEGNFNTSYYINAKGEVLGTYRKNHLYPSEHSFLKPGIEVPVFDTIYGKAGIVICWDMLFPEIFERMKKQGVQILYCPSYWYKEIAESMAQYNTESEEQLLDALCLARSVETNAAVIYCNAAGVIDYPNGTRDTLVGHSQAVMPVFGAVSRCNSNNEEMVIVDIDLGHLKQSAKIYRS